MIEVVDTSVLIDHLRGNEGARRLLSKAADTGELWSVTIVRTEILAGMRRGEERATNELLDTMKWQDVTVEVADCAGELARRFLKSHPGVDTVDFVIAAATQVLNGRLLTQNTKHFPMFPGLQRPY